MSTSASHGAFVDRLDRHRAILFKIANAYAGAPADREDLVGEMIVQLWRAYERFDGRSSFSTWMYRIAMNVAISFARSETRKRRHIGHASDSVFEEIAAPQEDTDDRLSLLRELIERLDPLNRALMILYLDDYPYSEIASILGISETNVATKIGRIKEGLKRNVTGLNRD
jgi:RNA polymerase sigma-70 factor, ECF subfamily